MLHFTACLAFTLNISWQQTAPRTEGSRDQLLISFSEMKLENYAHVIVYSV